MTCPNRACRRTDEHDAKGCVVAWERATRLRPPSRWRRLRWWLRRLLFRPVYTVRSGYVEDHGDVRIISDPEAP